MEPRANQHYLTTREVAAQLRLSQRTVRRLIRARQLTARRIGAEWLIDKSDLAAFIDAHTIPAQPGSARREGRIE